MAVITAPGVREEAEEEEVGFLYFSFVFHCLVKGVDHSRRVK